MRDYARLLRLPVSGMVALAAAFGYLLERPEPGPGLFAVTAGAALLAAACSAWNQVQERDIDALLPRTRSRPLPTGRIAPASALLAGVLCCVGAALFFSMAGGAAFTLAVPVVVLAYNGIYTPLKRRTAFALLFGALVGALPPLIGFTAAGGDARSPEALLVYGVYVLWQIPHFWLRVEKDSAAYAAANLPLPALEFPGPRYARLSRLWFHAYAAALLMLPAFPLMHSALARIAVAALGISLLLAGGMLRGRTPARRRLALALTDGSLLLGTVFLVADRMLSP